MMNKGVRLVISLILVSIYCNSFTNAFNRIPIHRLQKITAFTSSTINKGTYQPTQNIKNTALYQAESVSIDTPEPPKQLSARVLARKTAKKILPLGENDL
jgi:hypothetical protein